ALADRREIRRTPAQVGGDHRPHVAHRDVRRTDGDGHGDGRGEHRQPGAQAGDDAHHPDGTPHGADRGGPQGGSHPASPYSRSAAATFSTPSTVRIVGFMACPLSRTYRFSFTAFMFF